MQYRNLGNSDLNASVIGLGCWVMGGWMWGGAEEEDAIKAVHAALDNGINLIDTAPIYGFGRSEEIVGKALKGRRGEAILATKCGMVWDTDKGDLAFHSDSNWINENGSVKVMKYNGPDAIRREIEASLTRLDTDYIDLYQTHWQESTTPIEDTMACLLQLKDEGKIRAIGPCNINAEQIAAYHACGEVVSAQQKYSMLDRKLEDDALPFCREHNISILAYSPMELGLLTGKVTPEREFPEGDLRRTNRRFTRENRELVMQLLEDFKPVAEKHACTLAQLTLAWSVAQPGITHALAGARNAQQASENAVAGGIQLSSDDLAAMSAALEQYYGAGV